VLGKDYQGQDCALARALEVVGERWTLLIIRDALYGVRRFNDFQAHLDIPKAILSDRLNGLVSDGVFERLPDPDHRGRHLYQLSQAGKDLWPVIHALLVWGDRYRQGSCRVFLHADCDTPLDETGTCQRCKIAPAPDGIVTRPLRRTSRGDPVARALRRPHRMLDPIPDP
jgi:DNA-binding HxlR family transcriptional regulator